MRSIGFVSKVFHLALTALLLGGMVSPMFHEVSQAHEAIVHDRTHHQVQNKHEPHAEKPCSADVHHHDCALHHALTLWNGAVVVAKQAFLHPKALLFADTVEQNEFAFLCTPPSRAPPLS
ncbi:MAG: hypothetical protein JNN12_02570 [Bacteroidetes Order II. Incertae sedis bacterium]|nr:hypothetical protein [Bacteroidetes Order II. bacterium]